MKIGPKKRCVLAGLGSWVTEKEAVCQPLKWEGGRLSCFGQIQVYFVMNRSRARFRYNPS